MKVSIRPTSAVATVAVILSAHSAVLGQGPRYNVIELDPPPEASARAAGLNNAGQLCGTIDGDHAYLWSNGRFSINGDENRTFGEAINDRGIVAGRRLIDTTFEVIVWNPVNDQLMSLPTVPEDAFLYALNNVGRMAGTGRDSQAWTYDIRTDTLNLLQFGNTMNPPGINEATAVSASGVVSGTMMRDDFGPQAFTWTEAGGVFALEQPPGNWGIARGANDLGDVVGSGWDEFFTEKVALWQDGVWTDLGVSDPTRFFVSFGVDINNVGQIVGFSPNDIFQRNYGWVWQDGAYYDLEEQLDPFANVEVDRTLAINDNGEILAEALEGQFRVRSVILRETTVSTGGVEPGIAGMVNTVEITGASPLERVALVYGFSIGETEVGVCPGLSVHIANAQLAGVATADASGTATISGFIPGSMSGQTIVLQAIDASACTASHVSFATLQ